MLNETQTAPNWISLIKERLLAGVVNAIFTIAGLAIFIYFTVISQGNRIKAVEDISSIYVPRFIVVEEQVKGQEKNLQEIKDSQVRLEQKFDRVLERL